MSLPKRVILCCIVVGMSMSASLPSVTGQDERRTKKVKRVKRPEFSERDWEGTYFENLFEDGLVGERPLLNETPLAAARKPENHHSNSGGESVQSEFQWSNLIRASTLEDEVKRLQQKLSSEITTPSKFKSGYAEVHQAAAMLSLVFAIIHQYDGDVRWKNSAGHVQASFQRAAANSRVGSIQAYESCKRRKEDLEELVRGGKFPADEVVPDELDWSSVVDRTPVMVRLEAASQRIKQLTAKQGEFRRESESLIHESELIAALAKVLATEQMVDADEEDYADLANRMRQSASAIVHATAQQDFDAAATAANTTLQSCSDCHADWR